MTDLIKELKSHRLFRNTEDNAIAAIAKFSSHHDFMKKQFIFEAGNPADTVYLVIKGQISIELHHPVRGTIVLETLSAGQFIGLSWLNLPAVWTFDARSVSDVSVIKIDAVKLDSLCNEDRNNGYIIMKNLAILTRDRLQSTRLQLMDVYSSSRGKL